MERFGGVIAIIGINPYLRAPAPVVRALLKAAGRIAGPIPVRGKFGGHAFQQTLVLYRGVWRFYLNGPMRVAAGLDVGDRGEVELEFDPQPRSWAVPAALARELKKHPAAARAFEALIPSRRKEINRYFANLKSPEAKQRNLEKVIAQLLGASGGAARRSKAR